ncbi:MAG: alpha/beta hydrolase, partial [Acidimicrobiales bacterium]
RQILVLTRDGPSRKLLAWLGDSRFEMDTAVGQEKLLEVPSPFHLAPTETISAIGRWLDRTNRSERSTVHPPVRSSVEICMPGGHRIIEHARRFGPGLFGIRSEPVAQPRGRAVVMVNVGIDHHVGPGRLWVELARKLASRGVRALRYDVSGIGDSPPRSGEAALVVRSLRAFEDNRDAMLEGNPDDPRDVVLVGLCTGGYQVLEGALAERPVGVCAINPGLDFLPVEMEDGAGRMDPQRRFCVMLAPVVLKAQRYPTVVALGERFPRLAWRMSHRLAPPTTGHRLEEIAAAGVDTLLICGEFRSIALRESGPRDFDRVDHLDNFHMETIPELQHALPTVEDRQAVEACVLDYVIRRLGTEDPVETAKCISL